MQRFAVDILRLRLITVCTVRSTYLPFRRNANMHTVLSPPMNECLSHGIFLCLSVCLSAELLNIRELFGRGGP